VTPKGPKPRGVWLGGSPPKQKNVDIAAKWDSWLFLGEAAFA
jgi:hypothetical protein